MDTANDFLLGTNGQTYSCMLPPVNMTREQALRLAAWLVALADPMQRDFPELLDAVLGT